MSCLVGGMITFTCELAGWHAVQVWLENASKFTKPSGCWRIGKNIEITVVCFSPSFDTHHENSFEEIVWEAESRAN